MRVAGCDRAGQPAARVTDMHVCPMVTVLVPHVGGPILPPGGPPVLIGGMPAARMGDMAHGDAIARADRLTRCNRIQSGHAAVAIRS